MTYYDEQLQRLQAQTARAKQLESMLRELRGQQAALSARVQELEAVKRNRWMSTGWRAEVLPRSSTM